MNIELETFLYVVKNNPSANVPYHNTRHMIDMTRIAQNLLMVQGTESYTDGDTGDMTVLTLAGLFHDFAHSGGKEDDTKNVKRACKEAFTFLSGKPSISNIMLNDIIETIECTVFPFTVEPTTLYQKCIRDADVLYATMSQDPTIIMEKLRDEICVSQDRAISYEEMLEGQRKFMDGVILYTDAGNRILHVMGEGYMRQLEYYVARKSKVSDVTKTKMLISGAEPTCR